MTLCYITDSVTTPQEKNEIELHLEEGNAAAICR